jgi:ribonuclease-3
MMLNIDQQIAQIEQITAYTFNNKLFCAEALQMADASRSVLLDINGTPHAISKNDRLESLGDAMADAILCKIWYDFRDAQGTQPPFSPHTQ